MVRRIEIERRRDDELVLAVPIEREGQLAGGIYVPLPALGPVAEEIGVHPATVHRQSPYQVFVRGMGDMACELNAKGVEVINASRESTLPYWPKVTPADLDTL